MSYTELTNLHEGFVLVLGQSTELYLGLLLGFVFVVILLRMLQV